ncbi:FkbM family methyltransferase [Spirosoma sp. KCTC 42546]|uniref:FkbM family methyltransferase n=1 Tax=Spirosoma sp. KCTC 42546 TaxID=2520506 RepID=UPI00115B5056|nr:FkbM family methyltransferase [Spirosoma sp. KCTC 42546]QDK80506.1 FkbM family methyltransferase [Spirosoma sp. KCTC 42546]
MRTITGLAKKALGIHPQQGVNPLKNLTHIGSHFHGYHVPSNFLTSESICYCIGAGEDISFDTELKVIYDAQVFIFDPMPEGVNHFRKLKEFTKNQQPLTIEPTVPFTYRISEKQVEEITFVEIGVWDQKTNLKFFAPERDDYASHSLYLFQESNDYIEAPVDRLSNLMNMLGHSSLDVVKLEIEGAEYTVIDTIVKDKLDIKIILVEFDEVHNANDKSFHFRIKKTCKKLKEAGYVLVHSTHNLKRTFIREDVYKSLKNQENLPVNFTINKAADYSSAPITSR